METWNTSNIYRSFKDIDFLSDRIYQMKKNFIL